MDDEQLYIVINFRRDVIDMLGEHYDASMRDQYEASCPMCSESVSQDMDRCHCCEIPVIWEGSRVWKRLYGSPEAMKKKLTVFPPAEDDVAGNKLMALSGLTGFANITQRREWDRAVKKVGQDKAIQVVVWVSGQEKHQKNPRGIVPHALNVIKMTARRTKRTRPTTQS